MRFSAALRPGGAAVILALACVITACAADPGTAPTPRQDSVSEEAPEEVLDILADALAGPDSEGNDGRAFGSSDDTVIFAVEKTFSSKNAKATWDGSTLRVAMDGSAEAPTASIPCLALEGLLADGEDAVIVFGDGELVCADRHDTD